MVSEMAKGLFSFVKRFAQFFRDVIYVLGSIAIVIGWIVNYFGFDCDGCIDMYKDQIAVMSINMFVNLIVWTSLYLMVREVRISGVKSDVDRVFRDLRLNDYLTGDDAKYLYDLKDKMKRLGVNSYSQRKVDFLLEKDIR
jgi:hypothetical protein